jgi:hypothetical protein
MQGERGLLDARPVRVAEQPYIWYGCTDQVGRRLGSALRAVVQAVEEAELVVAE